MSYKYDYDLGGVFKRKEIYADDLIIYGDFTFGDAATDSLTINGKATFNADALVSTDKKIEFRNSNSYIQSGSAGVLTLGGNVALVGTGTFTTGTGNISILGDSTVSTDKKIQFRDTGIYINSGADGKLTISADGVGADDITLSGTVTISDDVTVASGKDVVLSGAGYLQSVNAQVTNLKANDGTASLVIADSTGFVSSTFSSATVGNIEPLLIDTTLTGIGATAGRAKFKLNTNVALGGWSNALKAEVAYGAEGRTDGLGSAFCGEMTLSAGTSAGSYTLFEGELNLGAGASTGTNTSLMYLSVNGAGRAAFDTAGYIMNIQGLTAASGKALATGSSTGTIAGSLKVRIGGTDYYIPLWSTEVQA